VKRNTVLKPIVFLLCLGPLALLAGKGLNQFVPPTGLLGRLAGYTGDLGANPIEVITHSTGLWTLIFLLITLSITPLRKLTGMLWLIQYRRMLGLFAFFYGSLHFTTYIWLDKFFDVHEMIKDIDKRPFITVGFTAFVLMIPLALTSTTGWIRRLGGKRWNRLHQLIYASACFAVIHFYWLVKKDVRRPVFYGTILGVLLLYRVAAKLAAAWGKRQKQRMLQPVRTRPAEQ
jgi:methionine sulfoxide reductase heme-binding subunit